MLFNILVDAFAVFLGIGLIFYGIFKAHQTTESKIIPKKDNFTGTKKIKKFLRVEKVNKNDKLSNLEETMKV